MNKKIIDEIVWWIPIKKLRNNIRNFLLLVYDFISETNEYKTINKIEINNYPKDFIIHENGYFLDNFIKTLNNEETFNLDIYKKLIKNLDDDSITTINTIISKASNMKSGYDETYFNDTEIEEIIKIIRQHNNKVIKINDNCYSYNHYFLPINIFGIDIFSDKIKFDILEKNNDYLKNKNIMDVGAFIGDTAIIFSEYTTKKVYSFEPLKKNYNLLLKTIELNEKENIIPLHMALGNSIGNIELFHYDAEIIGGASIKEIEYLDHKEIVDITTLDEFVNKNHVENIGLIKIDIEGAEEDFLLGAKNTIKKYRPILFISIYHNPKHFFDLKPMIENWNLNYKFRIIKPIEASVLIETMLIAIPEQSRAEQSRAEQS